MRTQGELVSATNRNELGDFLRSRRERLSPQRAGLVPKRRRRTPGLRREEVAELAGIGVDWYIRLEQGRTVTPSATTIDALAQALRLNEVEHQYLRVLVKNPNRSAFTRETVPETLKRMLETLPQPAYITGRRWDVLAWNAAAAECIVDFKAIDEEDRNILLYVFTDGRARLLFGTRWEDEAKRMLAMFRPTYDFWAGDPCFAALLRRLANGSPEFTRWWNTHEIRSKAGTRKTLHHPVKGCLHFDTTTFQANDDPTLTLALYTAA